MEVILLEKVDNLGALGEKVRVKSGYGRNFLIPQGKATPATPENVAAFEARRAELEKLAAEALGAAEAVAIYDLGRTLRPQAASVPQPPPDISARESRNLPSS